MPAVDYTRVTESPGLQATGVQIARLYERYKFARQFAEGKDVLEVACGSGMGLGYLAQAARRVVGGDIDHANVVRACAYYQNTPTIIVDEFDAHVLPYQDNSFDLVLLHEAIYYLKDAQRFVIEAHRILRSGGVLMIGTVNKDWEDFHPSPYACRYFSIPELFYLLQSAFPRVEIYGSFPVIRHGIKNKLLSWLKRFAVRYNLIPGSLRARAYVKRLFMGRLQSLPREIFEHMTWYQPPQQITPTIPTKDFTIFYAVSYK